MSRNGKPTLRATVTVPIHAGDTQSPCCWVGREFTKTIATDRDFVEFQLGFLSELTERTKREPKLFAFEYLSAPENSDRKARFALAAKRDARFAAHPAAILEVVDVPVSGIPGPGPLFGLIFFGGAIFFMSLVPPIDRRVIAREEGFEGAVE